MRVVRPDVWSKTRSLTVNQSHISEQISEAIEIAGEYGIRIEIGYDCDQFRRVCAELEIERKAQPIGLLGSTEATKDSFYVYGYNASNRIVHTQAVTYFDTGRLSLSQFFKKNCALFCSIKSEYDLERSIFDTLPVTHEMTGLMAYHGDIFISSDYRGTGLALPLTRIAIAKALQGDPDYIIGLVMPMVGYKGIPARYGYPFAQPNGMRWFNPATGTYDNEWLVRATPRDLENSLSLSMREEQRYLMRHDKIAH